MGITHKDHLISKRLLSYKDEAIKKTHFVESLNLKERMFIGAFLRESLDENSDTINVSNSINPIAPSYKYQFNILSNLEDNLLIYISSETDHRFITLSDDDNGSFRYDVMNVDYSLNVVNELSSDNVINLLIFPEKINNVNQDDIIEFWKEIALYECIEYLEWSVESLFSTEYRVGKKTNLVFLNLLNNFSVSQIYGIIYKATNNALRYYHENRISKRQAINTIVGNALNFGERAISNNWDLSKYSRIKSCPQSSLSKIFFDRYLKIGYDGFNEVPRKVDISFNASTNDTDFNSHDLPSADEAFKGPPNWI